MSKIYQIFGTDIVICLTDPASTRQIVTALKNEGIIKKGARFSSFVADQINDTISVSRVSHKGTKFCEIAYLRLQDD